MKPVISGKAAYLKNVMTGEYVEKNDPPFNGRSFLDKVYGEIPTSMYKAANLNLTFQGSEEITGNLQKDGFFDGIIGLIQKNKSDFSVFTVPLESFQSIGIDMPVKVVRLTGEDEFYIMSHPTYNRTAIQYDIEDSIMEIKPSVMVLYILIFALIHILICKVFPMIHNKIHKQLQIHSEGFKKSDGVVWKMFRLLLNQGSAVKFNLATQVWLFFAFECAVGVLICLYMNHMSSDLVAYSKPKLLKTLEDVWEERDEYMIAMTSHANVANRFKLCEEGSVERKLLRKFETEWEPLKGKTIMKDGKEENLYIPTLGEAEFLDSGNLIKERKLAFMAHFISVGIISGFECKGIKVKGGRPVESSLYVSENPIMIQHAVHVVNWNIDPALEKRLMLYQQRFMDHGIDDLVHRKGGEMVYNNIPMGDPVSIQCMNRKEWDDMEKGAYPFGLESCNRFLIHVCMALVPVIFIFVIEILYWNFWKWKYGKDEWLSVERITGFRRQIHGNPNMRKLEIRKRRMEAVERSREEIRASKTGLDRKVIIK